MEPIRTTEPERLRDLRECAARELLADNKPEEAAELLAAAGSFDALAELIREQAGSLLQQGRNRTLSAWIDELPDAIATGGWMRYRRGMALALSEPASAHAHLVGAYGRFRAEADAEGLYRCWSAIFAGIFHLRDAPRSATEWVAAFAELRRDFPSYPSTETANWCAGAMFMAPVMTRGRGPESASWRKEANQSPFWVFSIAGKLDRGASGLGSGLEHQQADPARGCQTAVVVADLSHPDVRASALVLGSRHAVERSRPHGAQERCRVLEANGVLSFDEDVDRRANAAQALDDAGVDAAVNQPVRLPVLLADFDLGAELVLADGGEAQTHGGVVADDLLVDELEDVVGEIGHGGGVSPIAGELSIRSAREHQRCAPGTTNTLRVGSYATATRRRCGGAAGQAPRSRRWPPATSSLFATAAR